MNSFLAPDSVQSWLELPNGLPFWIKSRCVIGRHAENDLVLSETSVSRQHALITSEPNGYTVADLESSNGTYLNRALVTQPTLLRDGDELHFGDSAVRYRVSRNTANSAHALPGVTARNTRESACWLLLANVAGFAELKATVGLKEALHRYHRWVAGIRPLIERDAGTINRYVGDGILAWWPGTAPSAQVRGALASIATWRAQSPVAFRVMLHHGNVLFTHNERGEQLSGPDVNFILGSDKVARGFGTAAMLSESAAHASKLDGHCKALGATTMEGVRGRFVFFEPPPPHA